MASRVAATEPEAPAPTITTCDWSPLHHHIEIIYFAEDSHSLVEVNELHPPEQNIEKSNWHSPASVGRLSTADRPPLTVQVVGNEIKRLRKLQGWTLEQLASASGVSAGLLSQVERGQGNPSFNTLVQVAHALGIPVARLVSGEQMTSPVLRREDRRRLNFPNEEIVVAELLTSRPDSALEVIRNRNRAGLLHRGHAVHARG